jgi:hypothetical protein
MIDGFYSVQFGTPIAVGSGVAILSGGTIKGGDATMFYTGQYSVSGENMTATVRVGTHHNIPGQSSVFGVPSATLTLHGRVSDGKIIGTASAKEAPGIKMSLTGNRIGD